MSGNGTLDKVLGGIPKSKHTHTDTYHRVEGHKVIVQTANSRQSKIPVISNSPSPIYLIARTNTKGELQVTNIAMYENHKIAKVIDLKFDKDGNVVPFSEGKGSHLHNWKENAKGDIGRTSHDKSNIYSIGTQYSILIDDVEKFNKQQKKI